MLLWHCVDHFPTSMATSSMSNGYAVTAHHLQRLRSLAPAERIYQEAVKAVQARPEHNGLDPDVVAKITSHQNVVDLTTSVAEQKETHPFWRSGDRSSVFDRTKSSIQTLLRFKDAITVLVQASELRKRRHGDCRLTCSRHYDSNADLGNNVLPRYCSSSIR